VLSNGAYETEINKLIRVSLKNGKNALDIGGNIGLQSIRMSQCVGDTGKVYAFEPLHYLQEKFRRNIALNNVVNVTLFPFALANKAYEAEFSIEKSSWNQGTFSLTNTVDGPEKQSVAVNVADDIPEIQELESLDFIKIDVEGFEFQVMQGLKETIKKHRPRIIFEYDDNYWMKTGQRISDCYLFLQDLNYTLYQITPVGCELIKQKEDIKGGNVFCIHE
jgi:FkbM family methyltransferase